MDIGQWNKLDCPVRLLAVQLRYPVIGSVNVDIGSRAPGCAGGFVPVARAESTSAHNGVICLISGRAYKGNSL